MHRSYFESYKILLLQPCYTCFTDDLSYNKSTTQSHTYLGTNYVAGNAVDENSTTCMRTLDIGSNSQYKTFWWKVGLGGVYNIYGVNVLF